MKLAGLLQGRRAVFLAVIFILLASGVHGLPVRAASAGGRQASASSYYVWWLARWDTNEVVCSVYLTHPQAPTGEEIESQCGTALRRAWEATPACKSKETNACQGLYLSLASSPDLEAATVTPTGILPPTDAASSTPSLSASEAPTPTAEPTSSRKAYWLAHTSNVEELAFNRPFYFLAGRLIALKIANAAACPNNGLQANGAATNCGLGQARYQTYLWQNRFDSQILEASKETGVPPYLLKGVFAAETQFWPLTSYNNSWEFGEFGLGQLNELGADTLLTWDGDFYKNLCRQAFTKETCKKDYISLPTDQRALLRGAAINLVRADCADCPYGMDIARAESSILVFAKTLNANRQQVTQVLSNATGWYAAIGTNREDLWKFTLVNYHAGPGCLYSALAAARRAGEKLNWKHVSNRLEPACQSAVDYVEAISHVEIADAPPTPTPFPTATFLPPTLTPTLSATPEFTVTGTPTVETATSTPDGSATPTATDATPAETPTPTATDAPTSTPIVVVNNGITYLGDKVLVKFTQNYPEADVTAFAQSANARVADHLEAMNIWTLEVPAGQVEAVISLLRTSPSVEFAEPVFIAQTYLAPNDPGWLSQPYLNNIQMPAAWDVTTGAQDVLVAVIDSGVDASHPELAAAIWNNPGETGTDSNGSDKRSNGIDDDANGYVDDWQGWNTVSASNDIADDNGHGTHVAGIIAAQGNNAEGMAGMAWGIRLLPVKAVNQNGMGTYMQVAEGIIYATDRGARIINLSLGSEAYSATLNYAVNYALQRGVLVIAATGDSGTAVANYPAAYPGVLGVGATDSQDQLAAFSTTGDAVDLTAPGVNVYSTFPGGVYAVLSGTSMSAAHVTGAAALLASQPQFATSAQIEEALLASALDLGDAGLDQQFGHGLLQTYSALMYAPGQPIITPTPLPSPTPGPAPTEPPNPVTIQAITALNTWSNVYHGTSTATQNIAYAVPAGSNTNRLMVVAIASSRTTVGSRTVTLTYGGQPLTSVAGDMAVTTIQQHTQLYYLNEAGLDAAANTTLSVTVGNGTTRITDVFVAVFDGVDQTAPITNSRTYNSGTTAVTNFAFATGLTVNAGDQAVEIISSMRLASTTTRTITYAPNWTMAAQQTWTTTDAVRNSVANRSIPATNITDTSPTTFSGTALASMTGMSLRMAVMPPTVTSPTAANILDTTATLGANVTSNGGAAITARGTCWDVMAAPTANCLAEGGTATGVFTHGRTALPAGTLVYYRGYASNSAGTGYSSDGSFYTEPATQASGVNFTSVGAGSLTVNWTRGSGNGVIVLMKAASAVDSDPVDGTYTGYTANAAFGSGTQIGTGNYVVYMGTGTSVTVTNLIPNTAYYVAVYEFAGTVDTAGANQGTNYKLSPATGNQTTVNGNTPPTVTISLPLNNSTFVQGTNITFSGAATDIQDGNLSANIQWISSINGTLGTGASISSSTLSLGVHTITARVTDSGGLTGQATIRIYVTDASGNLPPDVTILSPLNGGTFTQGKTITFIGLAVIPTNGDISNLIQWYDGAVLIGSGSSFGLNTLSAGTHTITARAADASGRVGVASISITVTSAQIPHGAFGATTDKCAICHRTHTAQTSPLIASPLSSNDFCLSCHASGERVVSTHSNIDWPGGVPSRTEPGTFDMLCIQCHEPHSSTNLYLIRPPDQPGAGDDIYSGVRITLSPLRKANAVFTSTTGANSYDEADTPEDAASNADDLCVACHVNTNNPGYPMVNHSGGLHNSGFNYIGQDCTSCHPHSLDASASTKDGFMTGCRACHNRVQDRGAGTPRRQIVGASGGDFTRASHHIAGSDAATDTDCLICHEMTQHKLGQVRLFNQDNPSTVYALTYANNTQADADNYEAFCRSCHDSDGRAGDTTPFSDSKVGIPLSSLWNTAQHNIIKLTFKGSCLDCHNNGHGSNKKKLLAPWNYTGPGTGTDLLNQEEGFCFQCHQTGSATGTPVQAAFTSYTNTATRFFKHDVNATYNTHTSTEIFGTSFGGASRHIDCNDCHESHKDRAGTAAAPTIKPTGQGASGVEPVFSGIGAPTRFNYLAQAANEYQVCMKCHSSYTTLPTYTPDGWGCTAACGARNYVVDGLRKLTRTANNQTQDTRDMARAFNPANASFHPLMAVGKNTLIPAGSFVAGWGVNSRVYCTDCHTNATIATGGNGPHGSNLLHLLTGMGTATNYSTLSSTTRNGEPTVPNTEICFKCHQYTVYVSGASATNTRFRNGTGTNYHYRHMLNGQYTATTCYTCHNSHGSGQQHLINFDASVAVPQGGRTSESAWTWNGTTGSCYVSCHGKVHSPETYTP